MRKKTQLKLKLTPPLGYESSVNNKKFLATENRSNIHCIDRLPK